MAIHINNLSKTFSSSPEGPRVIALHQVNLEVKRGGICGIIGMSGAGKSTLIRCLVGLEQPSEGSIKVDDEEILGLSPEALRNARRKIGMVFQHFNLFEAKSAWKNVAFPLEVAKVSKSMQKEKAIELLDLVGLAHKAEAYPVQLSGGEKQRVAIARALASSPSVLLCDEATSALDPSTTSSILSLLERLNQNLKLTILFITHEMEVVKQICTQVAVLEKGTIVEQGPVDKVFSAPEHPTTQRFLQNLSHEIPIHLKNRQSNGQLLRLFFKGEGSEKPIISRMVKTFDVDVNILLGGIDVLKTTTVGNLVIELTGPVEERVKARHFLEEHGVNCQEIV